MNRYCTRGNPVDWVTCDGTWGFDDCDDFSLPVSVWDEAMREQRRAERRQWFIESLNIPRLSRVPPVDK